MVPLSGPYDRPRGPDLWIGVTGHRLNNLAPADRDGVARAIETAIGKAAVAVRALGGDAAPTVLCGLAEGADRMAALAARRLRLKLAAIVPYRLDRYRRDFDTEASKREFARLLGLAAPVTILDGEAIEAVHGKSTGYAAAGAALADAADLVLAVWNGKPPAGPGGTAEVAARAADLGKPVLWLAPDTLQTRLIAADAPSPLDAALREQFDRTPRPVEMHVHGA
jgi:hypothetical protein